MTQTSPATRPLPPFIAALLALAVGAVLVTACGGGSKSSTPSASTTTSVAAAKAGAETTTTLEPEGGVGRTFYVYGPTVGDCIDLRRIADRRATTTRAKPGVDATPRADDQVIIRFGCDLPHQYEVISVVNAGLAAGTPVTTETLTASAKRLCPAVFATYIGAPYQSSQYEVGWVFPDPASIGRGSQTIGCLAFNPDGKLTGSVRDTRR